MGLTACSPNWTLCGEAGPCSLKVVQSLQDEARNHRPTQTFHSFRHTFIDDLRDAGVQDSLIKRMVGHEDSSVTFGIYGSRTPIKAMVEAMKHIK